MDLELDAGTGAGIKEYLRGLQASIESQEATIESLRCKNKRLEDEVKVAEGKIDQLTEEVSQLKKKLDSTETTNQKANNAVSITEEITQAAQEAVEDQFLRGMAYEETTGKAYLVNQNRLHQYIFIQILRNKRQLDSRKFKQLYDMHKKQKTSQICNGPTQF